MHLAKICLEAVRPNVGWTYIVVNITAVAEVLRFIQVIESAADIG